MRTADEPGAIFTNVSVSGPKGVITSQAPAPAARAATRSKTSRNPAAPELFLLPLLRLRRAILPILNLP